MNAKHLRIGIAVGLALAASIGLRAEDLVGYRVSTACSEDWDVRVNGALVVRHRPTGFGRCLYSGNLNRVVAGGTNTAELVKLDGGDLAHHPEAGGCVQLDIRFVGDYRGQSEFGDLATLLKHSGSESTNLAFVVVRPVPQLSGGSVAPPGMDAGARRWLVLGAAVLYALFINLYGFFLVVRDQSASKKTNRRGPASSFLWNAVLGGGCGQLAAMVIKRHNTDNPAFTVGIPMILLLQIAAIVFFVLAGGALPDAGCAGPARKVVESVQSVGSGWARFGRSLDRSDQRVDQ